MARKKKDLKAAKAAKQKKIAIVGAVMLLGLLAFSVPKTMKMLHPAKQAYKSKKAHSQSTTPGTAMPSSPTNTLVPTTPVSNTAVVLTAQLAPPAHEGQLSVLSARFKSKDPFRQLIDEDAASSSSTDTTTTTDSSTTNEATLKVVPSSAPETKTAAAPAAPAATAAPAAPDVHTVTLPFLSAVISVNGERQGVDVKVDFPTDAPLFHLISLTKKTAKISVSGGSLESGKATLMLRRGKPLTLVNTADGTRFRLVFVSASKSAAAKPPTTPTPSAEPGTPATPIAPTTTTTPTIGG